MTPTKITVAIQDPLEHSRLAFSLGKADGSPVGSATAEVIEA